MTPMKWPCHEMAHVWAKNKDLTRFSRFVLFEPAASTMQKTNPVDCFNLSLKVCFYTFISCYLKKIIKIGFPELEKKFLQRFRSFFVK